METPVLKPNKFIKLCYEEKNELKLTVAWTYQCYYQSWKMAFKFQPGKPNGVKAHLLNRHKTKINWENVVSWRYVDFKDLFFDFSENICKKYNVNSDVIK